MSTKNYKDPEKRRKARARARKNYFSDSGKYPPRRWDITEEKYIVANWGWITHRELANQLGRSVKSVVRHMERLKELDAL